MENYIDEFRARLVRLLDEMGYTVIDVSKGIYNFELTILIDSYNNCLKISFEENENYIYLDCLNIHEEIRHNGYGGRIVNLIIDIANEYETIHCIKLSSKCGSKGFWIKMGFRQSEQHEHIINRAFGQMILNL